MAAEGCVWDRLLATSDDPEAVLAEWINGANDWAESRRPFGRLELITDVDPRTLGDVCFDEVQTLPARSPELNSSPAVDIADTQFAQLIAAAIERDARKEPWSVLWIHSRFLTRCWDAPPDLNPQEDMSEHEFPADGFLTEEGESDVVAGQGSGQELDRCANVIPPEVELSETSHPDLITAWMNAYGCQIRLIDLLLDLLLESIRVDHPTLLLVGTSGFRLGQGGWIGHRKGPLRSPDIRLPLIVNRGGPLHIPQLSSSRQVPSLLQRLASRTESICPPAHWSRPTKEGSPLAIDSPRARIAVGNADWFYVQDTDHSDHLFVKPDDIDDFNDVGRLRQEVIQMLAQRT